MITVMVQAIVILVDPWSMPDTLLVQTTLQYTAQPSQAVEVLMHGHEYKKVMMMVLDKANAAAI